MNVRVREVGGLEHTWDDVEVSFDTTVLQIFHRGETTTFPLSSVTRFTTSESGPS